MNVNMYYHAKRENSTSRPQGDGTVFTCTLKEGTSVLNPVILLKWGGSGTPLYNYAYINAFSRYYFVDDWRLVNRIWEAHLRVDVLATYKSTIGNSTRYVLRSASSENKEAIETLYPAKATYSHGSTNFQNGLVRFGDGGYYVMTCINDQSISYTDQQPPMLFQMKAKGVQDVIHQVIDSFEGTANTLNAAAGADFKDAITMILKAPGQIFSDINQFVKSVTWFPCKFTDNSGGVVYVGKYMFSASGAGLITDPVWSTSFDISTSGYIPTGASLWKYMEPFASYYIDCPPFGIIPVPAEDMINCEKITFSLSIDALSGLGRLIVKAIDSSTYQHLIADRTGNFGITFPFGGSTPDYASGIAGAGAMGVAVAMAESGAAGAGPAMLAAIGTAAKGMGYNGYTSGSFSGGALGIDPQWYFNWRIYDPVDQDPTEKGYPLCETVQISSLSGFVQCQDGEISSAIAYAPELAEVKNYLEGGFFYE